MTPELQLTFALASMRKYFFKWFKINKNNAQNAFRISKILTVIL